MTAGHNHRINCTVLSNAHSQVYIACYACRSCNRWINWLDEFNEGSSRLGAVGASETLSDTHLLRNG